VSSFPTLDAELSGAFMPGLHVIHGGPGTGKTAWALQVAATCGTPALFVSCEITPLEIMRRLAARVTGTYLGRLKTGELSPAEAVHLAQRACESSPLLAIVDGTAGFPNPEWLQQQAADVRGDARYILIVVDSLHTWTARAGWNKPEYEALNLGLAELEQLAGALKAPLLAIAERSRGSMAAGGLSAAKGSARIEYAGESVLSFDTEYDKETKKPVAFDINGERPVWINIDKNRHGAGQSALRLLFHGAMQRFREG
jgi:replicative DNA helicase